MPGGKKISSPKGIMPKTGSPTGHYKGGGNQGVTARRSDTSSTKKNNQRSRNQ